jgi:long-chain acyl-CoA synthetase
MNLVDALLATALSDPSRVALTGSSPVTYGELLARAGAVQAHVQPDARVAIVAGAEPAFLVAYLGVLRAGGVAVPLNVAAPSHELVRQFEAVDPALVLASEDHGDLARRAVMQSGRDIPVVTIGAETASAGTVAREPSDLAVLLFTAGTGGAPKPAMLTHGSLLANLEQMQSHPGLRIRETDIALAVLPLFHVYGLNVVVGLALIAGGAIALVDHFHPAESLARVRDDNVTVIAAVPAIFDAWLTLDLGAAPANAFEHVRLCVSGATALADQTGQDFQARFGVPIHNGYGLTEASPVVTTTAVEANPRRGSVGPPLPGIEVKLLDADGQPVLEGDPGQIVVRGDNVFAGYWNDPGTTGAVVVDGWLQTGDIAVADADGWLTLVDRAKDVIIVSGFNVYPGEVEDALRTHADVQDVAVIGEPHPRTGETVVAFVVAIDGTAPDPVELLRHAGRRLARYKLPTRVEVVDTLPRTLAGKVVRRALGRVTPDATTNPA